MKSRTTEEEHVSEFKYLGCLLDESGTYEAACSRKVASVRRVSGAIRFLVNARNVQLECASVLHESLLVHVLTYGSERMIWREERSRIGWTTSGVYWVSGEWIKSRMYG